MTDFFLQQLQQEAAEVRQFARDDYNYKYESIGGPVATEYRDKLADFIATLTPVIPNGDLPIYFYYEEQGHSQPLHVDRDGFSLNVLCMLRQEYQGNKCSRLVLFPNGGEPKPFVIEPGYILCFYAGSIIHCREPIQQGEIVNLITTGFMPI